MPSAGVVMRPAARCRGEMRQAYQVKIRSVLHGDQPADPSDAAVDDASEDEFTAGSSTKLTVRKETLQTLPNASRG